MHTAQAEQAELHVREILERLESEPSFQGRYDRVEHISGGAFGLVFKAYCKDLRMWVALKVLTVGNTTKDIERFQSEANYASRLASPYIIQTRTIFVRPRVQWIEMEWVDGVDLEDVLRRSEPHALPLLDTLEIGIGAATALSVAHEAKPSPVVHRDVKPANFLLPNSKDPIVKLGDFGIARSDGDNKLTATGMVPGTPIFYSPEGCKGDDPTTASDIYCLGTVLYFMLSGNRAPFPMGPKAQPAAWARAIAFDSPTPLRKYAPDIPVDLEQLVVSRMMAKPEGMRPTAREVIVELTRIQDVVRASAIQPAGAPSAVSLPRIAMRTMESVSPLARAKGPLLVIVGLSIVIGVLMGRPKADRTAVPSPAVGAGVREAQPVTTAAAVVRVTLVGDELELTNGAETLRDVELELVGSDNSVHRMKFPGTMDAGEAASVFVHGFEPRPLRGATFVKAIVWAAGPSGRRSQSFDLRR